MEDLALMLVLPLLFLGICLSFILCGNIYYKWRGRRNKGMTTQVSFIDIKSIAANPKHASVTSPKSKRKLKKGLKFILKSANLAKRSGLPPPTASPASPNRLTVPRESSYPYYSSPVVLMTETEPPSYQALFDTPQHPSSLLPHPPINLNKHSKIPTKDRRSDSQLPLKVSSPDLMQEGQRTTLSNYYTKDADGSAVLYL